MKIKVNGGSCFRPRRPRRSAPTSGPLINSLHLPLTTISASTGQCWPGQVSPVPQLWLSANNGAPITGKGVACVIRRTTHSAVGVALGPHMFRTSAASTAAVYANDNPNLGSAILHHSHPSLTFEHYNRATCLSAAENFAKSFGSTRKHDHAVKKHGQTAPCGQARAARQQTQKPGSACGAPRGRGRLRTRVGPAVRSRSISIC